MTDMKMNKMVHKMKHILVLLLLFAVSMAICMQGTTDSSEAQKKSNRKKEQEMEMEMPLSSIISKATGCNGHKIRSRLRRDMHIVELDPSMFSTVMEPKLKERKRHSHEQASILSSESIIDDNSDSKLEEEIGFETRTPHSELGEVGFHADHYQETILHLAGCQSLVMASPGKTMPCHRWGSLELLWIAQLREYGEVVLVRHASFGFGVLRHYKKSTSIWHIMKTSEILEGPLACFGPPIWLLEHTDDLWVLLKFRVQSFYIDTIIGLNLASTFDHFNFIDIVGSGGFGSIYKGAKKLELKNIQTVIHPELSSRTCRNPKRWKKKLDGLWNFPAAFKVISASQEERYVFGEINNLIMARGIKGVPTLYDVFLDPQDNEITMMMEYVNGLDLYTRFLETTEQRPELDPIPIATISTIIKKLLLILQALHARNIIHRDIKSFNVMISNEMSATQFDIHLVDFGFASTQEKIRITDQVGSFLWIAPEIALKSHRASPKSDVWGLGVTLLELLELEAPLPPVSLLNLPTGLGTSSNEISTQEEQACMCLYIAKHGFDFINFKNYNLILQDFLARVLTLDPLARATVDELLDHPFITNYS